MYLILCFAAPHRCEKHDPGVSMCGTPDLRMQVGDLHFLQLITSVNKLRSSPSTRRSILLQLFVSSSQRRRGKLMDVIQVSFC